LQHTMNKQLRHIAAATHCGYVEHL
jgi:hypothetical protein